MSEASPIISSTPIHNSDLHLLLSHLQSHLPYCLPLFRRLQFSILHPNPPFASAFLATASSSISNSQEWLQKASHHQLNNDSWLAAHIDLTRSGHTNIWLFASWEVNRSTADLRNGLYLEPPTPSPEVQLRLMESLYSTLLTDFVPMLPRSPPAVWLSLKSSGKYAGDYSPSKVLFGTVHEKLVQLIPKHSITRIDPNYLKYIFVLPIKDFVQDDNVPLPEGYSFGPLQKSHLQAVLDHIHIPRTIQSLEEMVNLGLFHSCQNDPMGWGFLNKDSSLASLHIEEEHRGKNLAVLLSRELFRIQGRTFANDIDGQEITTEVQWGHADVNEQNTRSRRVMEKLGGKVGWRVAWVEVDLETIRRAD